VSVFTRLRIDSVTLACHKTIDLAPHEWPVPVNGYRPALARRGFRLAALTAAVVCVLGLAAGTFVLSYPGARDTAIAAGVSTQLARFYPAIFDGVFVVACAAALTLRGALRGYAWLAILVIAGSVATADAVHAMSVTVPKRPLEATVAIVPWAVLLIGFTLLYAMARQALPARRAAQAGQASANGKARAERRDAPDEHGASTAAVPLSALLAGPAERTAAADALATAPATTAAATAVQASPAPSSDSEPAAVLEPTSVRPPERDDPSDADAGTVDPSTHFSRLRSSPTLPED
jgi:hypothetical protein